MKTMTHRTTFALDQETAARLRRLSASWEVSQAEVVRRALALAETSSSGHADPASLLKQLHESGSCLARDVADQYLAQVHADRDAWRDSK